MIIRTLLCSLMILYAMHGSAALADPITITITGATPEQAWALQVMLYSQLHQHRILTHAPEGGFVYHENTEFFRIVKELGAYYRVVVRAETPAPPKD